MIKRIPRFAETTFMRLCAIGGATCNQSQEDENGWDFFVEFPAEEVSRLPPDLQPRQKSALVQVKSTTASGLSCRVKLSNALRFAKSPHPCFVVLVVARQNYQDTRLYSLHVWEDLVRETLKIVRVRDRDGRRDLHRIYQTIKFNSDHEKGDNLIPWMRQTIAAAGQDYHAVKTALVDSMGYEEGWATGEITIGPLKNVEDLVDHQLGLRADLPVTRLTMFPQRFGIRANQPLVNFENASSLIVRMTSNPVSSCLVRFKIPGAQEISVVGEIIAPNIPGLDDKYKKMRIRTVIADILWSMAGESWFTASLDLHARLPLQSIEHFVTLRDWFHRGQVDMQVWVDGQRMLAGELKLPSVDGGIRWHDLAVIIHTLRMVAESTVSVEFTTSLAEILAHYSALINFHGLVRGPSITLRSLMFDPGSDVQCDSMLYYAYVEVGNYSFMAVIERPFLSNKRDGDKYEATLGEAVLVENYAKLGRVVENLDILRQDYRRHLARRMDSGRLAQLGDGDATWLSGQLTDH